MKKTLLTVFLLLSAAGVRADFFEEPSGGHKKASHTFSVSAGPAWITSKVYTLSGVHTWRMGMEMMGEYSCVFEKGIGFGFTYAHNRTSYSEMGTMTQNYIGPSLVYAGMLGTKWHAQVDLGVGYANCSDRYSKDRGMGFKSGCGMEFLPNRHMGIGIKLASITSYLGKQPDNYPGGENDTNGIVRGSVTIGLHIYL